MNAPVVVVGGSLCGMAAAARLAAVGHDVVLLEREPRLGGRWVAATDVLPPVVALPAAWRDLFKKTGRTLDAELAARGLALTPAPAATHTFRSGATLTLPTDRGAQAASLTAECGESAAVTWRDFVDGLDDTWQALRPLGLEAEFPADFPRRLPRSVRDNLLWKQSVAAFAGLFPAELGQIVTAVALRLGSDPRRTPAWTAARLAVERAFGRWSVTDLAGIASPATVLIDVLAARMRTRGVDIRLNTPVTSATGTTVTTPLGDIHAQAVVSTVNPWQAPPLGIPRRRWRPLRPALAPSVTSTVTSGANVVPDGASEHVEHTTSGPIVTFQRQTAAGVVATVHDHTRGVPDLSLGVRWDGLRTWARLPGVRTGPGWYAASPASPGGNDPWAQLLSAALVVYALHLDVTGEDIRPVNKAYKPRVHRGPGTRP